MTLRASNFAAALLCPGKPQAEAMCAEPLASAEAARGTLLHRYFRTVLDRNGLSPADRDLLARADRLAGAFLYEFCAISGALSADHPDTDEHETKLRGIVDGRPDNILTWDSERIVAILDLKSGMGEQEEAPSNWQLAVYASLVWQRKPFEICGVCIVQPDAFGPKKTSAIYRAKDMPALLASIQKGKQLTLDPDARRNPGEEQCRFCRAKVNCREYLQSLDVLAVLPDRTAVETLSDTHLLALWRATRQAEKIRVEVDAEVRRRLAAGIDLGLKFRNTGATRVLFDPLAALDDLNAWLAREGYEAMSARAFDSCRQLQFGALERLFATITGLSERRAKEQLREILSAHTVETEKEKAIVVATHSRE